jgi:hypothetical protein
MGEKLNIKDKGCMGTYFTQNGRKEFKKVQHIK